MIIELNDTSTKEIAAELLRARQAVGGTGGMVLTLVVVAEDKRRDEVFAAAQASARAHPSRVIVVVYADGDQPRLDAEIQVGEDSPGDLLALRIHGDEIREHAGSVLLPLLLPDSPTIVWWPNEAPENPAADPVGALANRRITDAAGSEDPKNALTTRARNHTPGDTDLTWTRLTRWRALLAAALDQYPRPVTGAVVKAAPDNAPAMLLAAWLENRLGIEVRMEDHERPGVSEVRLETADGDVVINRGGSDSIALYNVPGEPERKVALKRRPLTDLITEELQRMDADDIFEAAVGRLLEKVGP
ncbi:glucose-6-phosphate dehydrogenase assembly protein OpcA [Tessaracoccus sp. OS52]|uniref:glucose-6-phosphate dehydrogenase assembly protein OpcA n=1 Tax=Tessaracoccus sp. OS52 TaxID=2886691 RepID=UPI001D121946|nr:glucose-6-phosphate dehydrogenase assembly protein OpcA [Tessaracoccus sp. OS52]MCC2593346.1 glucose-6-phosphate dehydrogenase assembly protein OpcA [Tessaracoccus sp. OS52]